MRNSIGGALLFATSFAGRLVYGYVSGGIASVATGGNFLMGAATGAIMSLANHGLHGGFGNNNGEAEQQQENKKVITFEKTGHFYAMCENNGYYQVTASGSIIIKNGKVTVIASADTSMADAKGMSVTVLASVSDNGGTNYALKEASNGVINRPELKEIGTASFKLTSGMNNISINFRPIVVADGLYCGSVGSLSIDKSIYLKSPTNINKPGEY